MTLYYNTRPLHPSEAKAIEVLGLTEYYPEAPMQPIDRFRVPVTGAIAAPTQAAPATQECLHEWVRGEPGMLQCNRCDRQKPMQAAPAAAAVRNLPASDDAKDKP